MEAEQSSRLIATPSTSVRSEHLDILYQTADVSSGAGVFSICVHSPVRSQQICRAVLGPVPTCSVHNTEATQYSRTASSTPEHLDNLYPLMNASDLDALHRTTDARGQEGWPTLHALFLLDRLCSFFFAFLFLHDCFTYDITTLLGTRRPWHHRHGDPPRSSIDRTVPHALQCLRVSTALHYDKRIAYS